MGSFVENVNKIASLTPANVEDLSLIVQNIDAINQVAPLADDLNNIIDNIIPNLDEILQADNSATTATEQATIATTQAGIATTKAGEAEQFRNEAEAFNLSKAFVVDTIEALSTITSSYTTAIVKDLNRGGTFIWSATGTANGGTVFAGGTGYWNRQYSGAVNVKWFGAKGDGVTDDTLAIQKTLDIKKAVYIPDGVFITSDTLYPYKQNIIGSGQQKTLIKANGDFNVFTILRSNGWGDSREPAFFSNFAVYGGGSTNNSYAFYAPGVAEFTESAAYCVGLTITDMYFELIGGGFYISDFFRVHISRIGMSGVTNPLKVVGSVVQSTFEKIANNFDLNMPSALTNIGFQFIDKTYLSSGLQGGENCTLRDCSAAGNHTGLRVTGVNLHFKAINLDLDYVRDYGIYCNNGFMTFENVWIALSNSTTKSNGIKVNVSSPTEPGLVIFKKCRIQGYALHSTSNAIEIGDGVNLCNGVTVEDCIIDTAGSTTWNYGIYLNKVDNVRIAKNNIKSSSISSNYAIYGNGYNSVILNNISPTKEILVKPLSLLGAVKIEDNTVSNGNGSSTNYVSNKRDYVSTTGSHTVVINNLYDTLGGSYTQALIELTLVGINVFGSGSIASKYYVVATGLGTWSIGTPVKVYGSDISITLSSSTSTSITLTVSSAASISSLSVYTQITAQGDGILILK